MPRNTLQMNAYNRQEPQKMPKRRHLGIILIGAMLLFALASMSLVSAYQGLQKQVKIERQTVQQNQSLDDSIALKKSEVTKLKDPDFLQKYARARYNYSKSGEKIFSAPALTNGGITP